jgi:hypothetical protein
MGYEQLSNSGGIEVLLPFLRPSRSIGMNAQEARLIQVHQLHLPCLCLLQQSSYLDFALIEQLGIPLFLANAVSS